LASWNDALKLQVAVRIKTFSVQLKVCFFDDATTHAKLALCSTQEKDASIFTSSHFDFVATGLRTIQFLFLNTFASSFKMKVLLPVLLALDKFFHERRHFQLHRISSSPVLDFMNDVYERRRNFFFAFSLSLTISLSLSLSLFLKLLTWQFF
jgi:hypothetical protein